MNFKFYNLMTKKLKFLCPKKKEYANSKVKESEKYLGSMKIFGCKRYIAMYAMCMY